MTAFVESHALDRLLGARKSDVRELLGDPEAITGSVEFYQSELLTIWYDQNEKVIGAGTYFEPGGRKISRRVLGAGAGDSFEACLKLWGEPERSIDTPFGYRIAHWSVGSLFIEAGIWTHKETTEPLGPHERDSLKEIAIHLDETHNPKRGEVSDIPAAPTDLERPNRCGSN